MDEFLAERPRLFGIAYRMLGSVLDAEDVLQDAWLRYREARGIASARAWLTTVVTRLSIDRLRATRATREHYSGPWLPEPLPTQRLLETHRDAISLALLVLLERLSPLERAVFVLHEVFEYTHSETAAIIENTEEATRQLFHRAKQNLSSDVPRYQASPAAHARLLQAFLTCIVAGDLEGLKGLLADDATHTADAGGKVMGASRKVVHGAERVARLWIGIFAKLTDKRTAMTFTIEDINGCPSLLVRLNGEPFEVLSVQTDGRRIHRVHAQLNPDKLSAFR